MHMDIFSDDAFSAVTMTEALEDYEFKPDLIGSLGLFEDIPTSTTSVSIERRGNTLQIIPTSLRGTPPLEGERDRRNLRSFETTRIAKGQTLQASEIQNLRAFGEESELEQMIAYMGRYARNLVSDVELTWENMMLGAVQGVVYDADGSVLHDWFSEWGIAKPAPFSMALDDPAFVVEGKARAVLRTLIQKSAGNWNADSYGMALCGDDFFDALTGHKSVRETFLNTSDAALLRRAFGVAGNDDETLLGSTPALAHGGIVFINYRGIDSFSDAAAPGTKNALGIKSDVTAALVRQTTTLSVELDGLSRRAGVSAEALQELKHAASTRGVELNTLTEGFRELNLRAGQFISTGKGPAADAFKRLGYSASILKQRMEDPAALLGEIIEQTSKLDQQSQMRVLNDIFGGSAGADFVKMAGMSAEEIWGLRVEARKLGIVLGDDVVAVAANLDTAWSGLMKRFEGMRLRIGAGLIPVFQQAVDTITEWVDANRELIRTRIERVVDGITRAIRAILDPASELRQRFASLVEGFSRFYENIRPVIDYIGGPAVAALALLALYVSGPLGRHQGGMVRAVRLGERGRGWSRREDHRLDAGLSQGEAGLLGRGGPDRFQRRPRSGGHHPGSTGLACDPAAAGRWLRRRGRHHVRAIAGHPGAAGRARAAGNRRQRAYRHAIG